MKSRRAAYDVRDLDELPEAEADDGEEVEDEDAVVLTVAPIAKPADVEKTVLMSEILTASMVYPPL